MGFERRAAAELDVRRLSGHLAFCTAVAGFAGLALWAGWSLHRADQVNAAIAATTAVVEEALPESRLTKAQALAASGDYDSALAAYKSILRGHREDLRRIALYDAGNLHLRRALHEDPENLTVILPLVELAKQNYRDLLREDPTQWDARYNLERALRLAPENDASEETESPPPENRDHAQSTNDNARMDLP